MGPEDIKRIRRLMNWSQERLARELGVSFCTVNRWEKARTSPSPLGLVTLKRLVEKNGLGDERGCVRAAQRIPFVYTVLPGALPLGAAVRGHGTAAHTENISQKGMMFRTGADLKPGQRLLVRLDAGEGSFLEVAADVVWRAGRGKDGGVGLSFRGAKQKVFEDLARILKQLGRP